MHFEMDMLPPPTGPICDFCSAPEVWASYPAKTFHWREMNGLHLNSVGGWAACKRCAELIEAENWDGLLERSWQTLIAEHPWMRAAPEMKRELKNLQDVFRKNRELLN